MATDITVPELGESVTEATVAKWLKAVGEPVAVDETLVELETDKITVEVSAPANGALESIAAEEGSDVAVGAVLARFAEGAAPASTNGAAVKNTPVESAPVESPQDDQPLSPAVRKLVDESGVDPASIKGTGKDGRLTKGDVLAATERTPETQAPATAPSTSAPVKSRGAETREADPRGEERVRMTKLRRTVATRLKQAQNEAALLTTFNEVDMSAIIALRYQHRDAFEKKHGVRLGFMSFFVRAVINALRETPGVNAEIRGDEIIYKNYYDIGIAVGSDQGLVVPVLKDADRQNFAGIEAAIREFGTRARDGKLTIQELTGGTFTITNGGIFGSLLSTPILNPPQSGILGMHKIEDRPIAIDGEVKIRPMMYIALTYDHRVVDGREAVTFLVRVKEAIEDPERMLLEI